MLTVYSHFMRVVLRNYRVVVRIASFDQAADHAVAFQHKHSVAFVKFDGYCSLFFRKQVFQQCSGLLRKDERGTFVSFGSQRFATYQLMTVRCHHRDVFCCNIEIYTVHYRTELVIGSCEYRTVDATQQYTCFHLHADCIFAQHSRLRKFVSILSHQTIFSVLILHGDFIIVRVDVECQRLFRNFFQCIKQCFRYYGKTPVCIAFIYLNGCHHGRFTVRNSHRQCSVFQFEEKTIENRQRIL